MEQRTPVESSDPDQSIDSVFNFRDLGGFPVMGGGTTRPGLVYRSAGLHRTDAAGGERLFALGLRQVIDLRTAEEGEREGRFSHPGMVVHHVSIVERLTDMVPDGERPPDDLMRHNYRRMLADNGGAFGEAIRLVARATERGEPVVFQCTAGKDRTGVLAALILSGVGVADDHVAADYARSAADMARMVAWYRDTAGVTPADRMTEMGMDPSLIGRMLAAEPASIRGTLDDLRAEHGDLGRYLERIGAAEAIRSIAGAFVAGP